MFRDGVAVFDDASSLTLAENGEILPEKGDGTDEYVFAYGKEYREAVKALYLIAGRGADGAQIRARQLVEPLLRV